MKKISILLAATILIGNVLFTGCADKKSENPLEVDSKALILYKPLGSYGIYFENAVSTYQRLYPDVDVQVREFGSETTDPNVLQQNYNNLKDTLNTELTAGKGPDVVMWVNELDDPYKAMKSGAFDDLNMYIFNDSSFDLTDYQETILSAGVYDEKQYLMPLEYRIPLFMSTKEVLEENLIKEDMELSFDDYLSAVVRYVDRNNASPFTTKGVGLSPFLPWSGLDLIDYESFQINEQNIKSEVFENIMATYKSYYNLELNEMVYAGPTIDAEMLLNHQAIFTVPGLGEGGYERTLLRGYSFISKQAVPIINTLSGTDGEVVAEVTTKVAIRANSENKQNAWNFIKVLLSAEVAGIETSTTYFPVCIEALEKKINNQIEAIERLKGNPLVGDISGILLNAESISTETVEKYRLLLTDVDRAVLQNSAVDAILRETMEPFLKSEKSYMYCVENLEQKLALYIDE